MKFTSTDRYEIMARAFHRDTGLWPPGKDRPSAMGGHDEAEAKNGYAKWLADHGAAIGCILAAVEQLVGEDALEAISPAPALDTEKASMLASIQIVLERLRPQCNALNPSLMAVRQCVRELSRYELEVAAPDGKREGK